MMTLKNTAKLILTAAMTLASSTTFGAEDCEKGDAISRLHSNLIAVASAQGGVTDAGRTAIVDLANKPSLSETEQVAIAAAHSTVAVKSISKDGKAINDFGFSHHGSAFVFGDGCFVVTVRHVVNKDEIKVVNGRKVAVPSEENPVGSRVNMEIGFAPGQEPEVAAGEVIFAGSSPMHADSDIGIIRLDRKAHVTPLSLAAPDDEQLIGAEMVSVGLPGGLQNGSGLRAFADTDCRGITDNSTRKRVLGGIPTSCRGSAGDSGGPVMAKIEVKGQRVWRAVGAMAQVNSQNSSNVSTGQTGRELERVRAFPFNRYKQDIQVVVRESLKQRPCQ